MIAGGGKPPSKNGDEDDDDDVSICNKVSSCFSENKFRWNASEFICFDLPTSRVTFGVTLSVDLDEH